MSLAAGRPRPAGRAFQGQTSSSPRLPLARTQRSICRKAALSLASFPAFSFAGLWTQTTPIGRSMRPRPCSAEDPGQESEQGQPKNHGQSNRQAETRSRLAPSPDSHRVCGFQLRSGLPEPSLLFLVGEGKSVLAAIVVDTHGAQLRQASRRFASDIRIWNSPSDSLQYFEQIVEVVGPDAEAGDSPNRRRAAANRFLRQRFSLAGDEHPVGIT